MSVDIKFTRQTHLMSPAKDCLDVGTFSFGTVLTSVAPGWEVISPEDVFITQKLKGKIQNAVTKTVNEILAGEESDEDDEEPTKKKATK
jgi:hypothetical protein